MKLTTGLFCLSLAMASGVAPASAQVYFGTNSVQNSCQFFNLTLKPQDIVIPSGDNRVISNSLVTGVSSGTVTYTAQARLNPNPLSFCSFSECRNNRSVLLTCAGGPTPGNQAVLFVNRGRRAR